MDQSAEKFFVKWNDFQSTICSSFEELLTDGDFFDVTLVCDDRHLQAHKVILSSCSPLLRSMLRRCDHPHPLILLRGIDSKDLSSLLSFIYQGQVNVSLKDVDSFMRTATDLQVKGLCGEEEGEIKETEIKETKQTKQTKKKRQSSTGKTRTKTNTVKNPATKVTSVKSEVEEILEDTDDETLNPVHIVETCLNDCETETPANPDYTKLDREIAEQVEEVTDEDGNTEFRCKWPQCDKTNKTRNLLMSHIEIHLTGYSHPCPHCGKTFKTRNCLGSHVSKSCKEKKRRMSQVSQ